MSADPFLFDDDDDNNNVDVVVVSDDNEDDVDVDAPRLVSLLKSRFGEKRQVKRSNRTTSEDDEDDEDDLFDRKVHAR
jgi:hypothetical protein